MPKERLESKEEKRELFKRIQIILLGFLFLFLSGCLSKATADVEIKASVDKDKLKQNEALTLSIDISGDISSSPKINLPDLNKDFEILSTSQSQNVSLRGKETNLIISFRYILLPKNEGKITIGSVEARYKKDVYKTEPIEIEVLPADKSFVPEAPSEELPPQEEKEETII